MKGAVLAAGLGTRLRPLSDERPKPAFPLLDVPLCRYGLAMMRRAGIAEVGLNLHYLPDVICAELRDEVRYVLEPEILGTGGGPAGIARALALAPDEELVVANGKVFIDLDLATVIDHHRRSGAVATMVVREVADAKAWGAVDVDDAGRVRDILGDGRHMFCGVHVWTRALLDELPAGVSDSVRQGYLPLLRRGAHVAAFVCDGAFAEHSTPRAYLDSNLQRLRGEPLRHAVLPPLGVSPDARVDPAARIEPPVLIAAGARVEAGAAVGPFAVVGKGATVARGAMVREAVVWPGAQVEGSCLRAIATVRGGIVAVQ